MPRRHSDKKALARKDRPAKFFQLAARRDADHPIILRAFRQLIGQEPPLGLVHPHHGAVGATFGKQAPLGREIAAHAVVPVQMVGRKVGKHRDVRRQRARKLGLIRGKL